MFPRSHEELREGEKLTLPRHARTAKRHILVAMTKDLVAVV
jgi:hypothetical protein